MGLEKPIEDRIVSYAESIGYVARKLKWIGRRAGFDRCFVGHNRCVFIEVKRPGEIPNPLQAREYKRFKALYPDVHWVDNFEDAKEILRP